MIRGRASVFFRYRPTSDGNRVQAAVGLLRLDRRNCGVSRRVKSWQREDESRWEPNFLEVGVGVDGGTYFRPFVRRLFDSGTIVSSGESFKAVCRQFAKVIDA